MSERKAEYNSGQEMGGYILTDWISTTVPHSCQVIRITGNHPRPNADEVWIIHWEEGDVMIPWPEGVSMRRAIMDWALEQPDL